MEKGQAHRSLLFSLDMLQLKRYTFKLATQLSQLQDKRFYEKTLLIEPQYSFSKFSALRDIIQGFFKNITRQVQFFKPSLAHIPAP